VKHLRPAMTPWLAVILAILISGSVSFGQRTGGTGGGTGGGGGIGTGGGAGIGGGALASVVVPARVSGVVQVWVQAPAAWALLPQVERGEPVQPAEFPRPRISWHQPTDTPMSRA
jgi:hypothetical protein